MKPKPAVIAAIVVFSIAPLCNAQTQETPNIETVARVVRLLEGSGYRYSKLTQSAWFIAFKGNSKESLEVTVSPDRDDLVFLSVIADRGQLDNNAAALRQLLKANAGLPEGLSVMLDGDDDYIVLARSPLKQLNAATFKETLLSVASAADEAFGSAIKASPVVQASASLLDEAQITTLKSAASREPTNAQPRTQLGNLYFDAERYADAANWYNDALKLAPRDVNVRTDLGVCYYYLNEPDKALEQFNQSLKIDPKHVKTLLNLGIVRAFGKQDLDGATQAWEKVLKLSPDGPEGQAAKRALETLRSAHSGKAAQNLVADAPRVFAGTYNAPGAATQEIDILNGKAAVSLNPSLWKETKSSEPGRRTFQHKNGDGYAMIIAERIEIPLDQMKQIALGNARDADPDVKIVEEQRRRVNGTDVLLLRLEGKTSGIAFTYLGYYYGGPAGTVQVIGYTGQNLFQEYRRDFEDFLNGFHLK